MLMIMALVHTAVHPPRRHPPWTLVHAAVHGPPLQSPVARHGQLRTQGNKVVDEEGNPVHLRGMSLFWSQWSVGSKFYTRDVAAWLRDDWGVDLVRAAMAIEHGGYLSNKDRERVRVEG